MIKYATNAEKTSARGAEGKIEYALDGKQRNIFMNSPQLFFSVSTAYRNAENKEKAQKQAGIGVSFPYNLLSRLRQRGKPFTKSEVELCPKMLRERFEVGLVHILTGITCINHIVVNSVSSETGKYHP